MKEERDRRGHIHGYLISSRHDEEADGQINTKTGGYTMAEGSTTRSHGISDSSGRPKRSKGGLNKTAALLILLGAVPATMARSCIPLSGSTTCPAFSSASISTDSTLVGLL
jgi:hypothetical protein